MLRPKGLQGWRHTLLAAVAVCAALAPCGQAGWALTLYVAPDGQARNDGLSRTQQAGGRGPLPSLETALATMRGAAKARSGTETDRIVMLPGRYELAQAVALGPQDSGASSAFPLVIEAETPGTVMLVGSRQLSGFKPVQGKPYVALPTDLPRGFHMLWVNGERATRARSPNQGGFHVGATNASPPVAGDRFQRPQNPQNIDNTRRLVLPASAQQALQLALKQGPLDGLVMHSMHAWTTSAQRVSGFDAATGMASVTPDSLWPFLKFGPDQRFALDNLPAFLDEPGEWWLAPDGELRLMPPGGQPAGSLKAEVPQLERLLELAGTESQPVEHIHFKGLRLAYSAAWLAPFIDSQAATAAPSALVMTHARGIVIERCAFEHLGGYAVSIRQGSRRNVIRDSVMRELGAGGIRVGETTLPQSDKELVEANRIENNLIEDVGRAFPGAIGIWVGQSGGNTISHNEVRRTGYTGISLGWTWGFGASKARDNVVEYNHLHDIGQGVLSDLGAVYTLGISPGTRIHHNLIEDVRSFRKMGSSAWGIYLDEGSGGITVEFNVISRTTGGGLHLHYGNDNTVRNNVLAHSEAAQARRSRKTDSRLRFERNVLVAGDAPLFFGEWLDGDLSSRSNILVSNKPADLYRKQGLDGLRAEGIELGSVVLGSKAVQCSKFTCKVPAALAQQTGFEPFSVEQAGLSSKVHLAP